jgi:hypothetical protein
MRTASSFSNSLAEFMDNVYYDMYKMIWVLKHVNFAGIVVHAPDDRHRFPSFSVRLT